MLYSSMHEHITVWCITLEPILRVTPRCIHVYSVSHVLSIGPGSFEPFSMKIDVDTMFPYTPLRSSLAKSTKLFQITRIKPALLPFLSEISYLKSAMVKRKRWNITLSDLLRLRIITDMKFTKVVFLGICLVAALCILILIITFVLGGSNDRRTLSAYAPKPRGYQNCSNDVIRKYILSYGRFPGEGVWDGDEFYPKLCTLRHNLPGAKYIETCFQRKGISKILTFGDSNGVQYNDGGLMKIIEGATHKKCDVIRKEQMLNNGFLPEAKYFAYGNEKLESMMTIRGRRCRTCNSREHVCQLTSGAFHTEHVSMSLVHELSITINGTDTQDYTAATYQEFLFTYYLELSKPDIVIIFLPFSHMTRVSPHSLHRAEIEEFVGLVAKHTKRLGIQVYFIPSTCEFEDRKNREHKGEKFEGRLATDVVKEFNGYLVEALKPIWEEGGGHVHAFLDMYEMSRLVPEMSSGGVHFKYEWYPRIFNYILRVICESSYSKMY